MATFRRQELEAWAQGVFRRAGLGEEDALSLARILCAADAMGVHTHGLVRLEEYVPALRSGAWRPSGELKVLAETPAAALVDGASGVGPLLALGAMRLCIQKASAHGVGLVGLRNGGHFGRAAYYAEEAARHGMIGVAMTNASPCIAPWGGRERVLGNNPLAIAVPRRDHPPIVLDMALSVAAQGKIRFARDRGEEVPEGWGLDPEGRPTRDPRAILAGSLLPVGGYKGYGLALMVDLLTGVLSGSGYGREVSSPREWRRQNIGQLFVAIDVRRFRPLDAFYDDVERLVAMVKGSALAPGHSEILLPGELEQRHAEAMGDRIELPDDVCRRVQRVAAEVGHAQPLPVAEAGS